MGALLLALCAPAFGQTSPDVNLVGQCESRLAPTRIDVRAVPAAVRYDFGRSLAELNRMAPAGRSGYITTGLTVRTLQTRTAWGSTALVLPDGTGCMRPDLSVSLQFLEHTVYVAREFAPGSCPHNDTLEHERIHVRLNERQAAEAARTLREQLQAFFGNRIFYGDIATLRAQLAQALQSDWLPVVDAQLARGAAEHAAFDKHQLDEAIRACPKEKQLVLRAAQQAGGAAR